MKIKQLIPVNNYWSRYKDTDENGKEIFHFSRITFFALVEEDNLDDDILPVDFDDSGFWDLECGNRDGWIYSEKDLSSLFLYKDEKGKYHKFE